MNSTAGSASDNRNDLQDQIDDLDNCIGELQSSPLGTEASSGQIARLEKVLGSLRGELFGPELAIIGIELTQATQFFAVNGQGSDYAPDNSVPLIAQRGLMLRVYISDRRRRNGPYQLLPKYVTGQIAVHRVHQFGADTQVATLRPINGLIRARAAAAVDRGEADHTLNFRLSAAKCQGHLRFRATIQEQLPTFTSSTAVALEPAAPTHPQTEPATAFILPSVNEAEDLIASPEGPSPTMTVHGRFERVPTFRVRAVLIHYTGDGMDVPAPSGLEFAQTFLYVLATYPIGRLEFGDCVEVEYDGDLSAPGGGCGPGWEGLLSLLRNMSDGSDDDDIYVALVPRGALSPYILGCGNTGVAAAFNGDGDVLAQEIGHAFGRKHAPAGGAPGADPNYPAYGNYPMGSIGEFGVDVFASDIYDPARTFDFMGYRSSRWVSPYTYMGLRNAMVERFSSAAMARVSVNQHQETLFLTFRVHREGKVEVFPSFHLPSKGQPIHGDATSDISCELLDRSGRVLHFHRCQVTAKPQDADGPHIVFQEALPWIDHAVAIRFLRKRDVLHIHEIEKAAPEIKIVNPKIKDYGKTINLEWSTGSNKAAPTYMVRYSNDGGATWRAVAANVRDTARRLNTHLLPGGERCMFQIVASSGIRTTVARTEPFSAPRKPRVASILLPEPKTELPGRAPVLLRGGAFSPDFGTGDMSDVVWSSNLDGVLGSGIELVVDNLSTGFHTITLTVPDGICGVATAAVSIRICDA